MRICANCRAEDRRITLPLEDCTCGAGFAVPDYEHTEECELVGHWVLGYIFPQVLKTQDLIRDPEASHGWRLPVKYSGWELVERPGSGGKMFARRRLLCRTCIVDVVETEERRRAIDKAKKDYGAPQTNAWADAISGAV